MHFSINAATEISFHGDRYLHVWVLHDFQEDLLGGEAQSTSVTTVNGHNSNGLQ